MREHLMRTPVRLALLATIFFLPVTMSGAQDANSLQQVVNGVEVYLGVVPAEMIAAYPRENPERKMHGGAAAIGGYHVVVALFDATTGRRITDAHVSARLGPASQPGPETQLEPMTINGARNYGNYLDMVRGGSYRIDVQIRRPGSPDPIHAIYQWTAN